MAELGESADPRALVPRDPTGIRAVAASMSRLGAGLIGAGDGLRRIETTDWEGDAADAFRLAFDPIPDQWVGTGRAFLDAADAITGYADVLEWAQTEAGAGVVERLHRAREELRVAGDTATPIVARVRDVAPAMPSVAQQLGGVLGDVAGGVWNELVGTGQFLWSINPTRFLIEPAAAVDGWQDIGAGAAHAAQHPRETFEQALNPRELATNPARWLGSTLAGLGLSALGGAGAAGRAERVTRAAAVTSADGDPGNDATGPTLGRYNGLTAREHGVSQGVHIGRPGSAKSMKLPIREVDTAVEINEIFDALSSGGQIVHVSDDRTVVLLGDDTFLTYRPTSSTPPNDPAVDVNAGRGNQIRVHTPVRESR